MKIVTARLALISIGRIYWGEFFENCISDTFRNNPKKEDDPIKEDNSENKDEPKNEDTPKGKRPH